MPEDRVPSHVRDAAARLRGALPQLTDRLTLRPLTSADLPAFLAYRSQPAVTRYLSHPALDERSGGALLDRWLADPADVAIGLVELEHGGVPCGDVRVTLRPAHAMAPATTLETEAWISYAVHPDQQGQGLAGEAVGRVVDLLLDPGTVGVRRITTKVFSGAAASSRLLARLGFHLDGVDRAVALAPDGASWYDDECWSLLATDVRPTGKGCGAAPTIGP